MNVLMITQKVDINDDILGFTHTWINKIAEKVDKLYVITLGKGETNLAKNVKLYSMGKEKSYNKLKLLFNFNKLIIKLINKTDVIFVHMSPLSTIIVAFYAKIYKIPIVMWYAHKHVDLKLKIAHFFANKVITASKESFRLKSHKVKVIGHGIDTDKFKPIVAQEKPNQKYRILSVGRISPVKNYEVLISAANILINKEKQRNIEFVVIGGVPIKSQEGYFKKIKKMIAEFHLENYMKFIGSVPYTEVVKYYQNCDVFINTSLTGSVDKSGLEAMACGKPVLTCNEGYTGVFKDSAEKYIFDKHSPDDLVKKLQWILEEDMESIGLTLRSIVEKEHSVDHLTIELVRVFQEVARGK